MAVGNLPESVSFEPVEHFERCARCGDPSVKLVPLLLPVLPFTSKHMVERRICDACVLSLRLWFMGSNLQVNSAPAGAHSQKAGL